MKAYKIFSATLS